MPGTKFKCFWPMPKADNCMAQEPRIIAKSTNAQQILKLCLKDLKDLHLFRGEPWIKLGISINGGTPPLSLSPSLSLHFNGIFPYKHLYKPYILRYPHLWKPPNENLGFCWCQAQLAANIEGWRKGRWVSHTQVRPRPDVAQWGLKDSQLKIIHSIWVELE